jgi:hypothetical protein
MSSFFIAQMSPQSAFACRKALQSHLQFMFIDNHEVISAEENCSAEICSRNHHHAEGAGLWYYSRKTITSAKISNCQLIINNCQLKILLVAAQKPRYG